MNIPTLTMAKWIAEHTEFTGLDDIYFYLTNGKGSLDGPRRGYMEKSKERDIREAVIKLNMELNAKLNAVTLGKKHMEDALETCVCGGTICSEEWCTNCSDPRRKE